MILIVQLQKLHRVIVFLIVIGADQLKVDVLRSKVAPPCVCEVDVSFCSLCFSQQMAVFMDWGIMGFRYCSI